MAVESINEVIIGAVVLAELEIKLAQMAVFVTDGISKTKAVGLGLFHSNNCSVAQVCRSPNSSIMAVDSPR